MLMQVPMLGELEPINKRNRTVRMRDVPDALEWVAIVAIVAVLFIWGPQKIPGLAKALGRAKKEYQSASKEIVGTVTMGGETSPEKSADELLVQKAKELHISTEGKTREQILQEIASSKKQ